MKRPRTRRTHQVGAAGALVATMLVAACASTAELATTTTSPAVPTALAPSSTVAPSLTPVPGTSEAQVPQQPLCPGPDVQADEPLITARVDDGPAVPGLVGSYSLQTCTASMSVDKVAMDPTEPIVAMPGDTIDITVGPGWRILRWSAFDFPVRGEGINAWPEVETPDGPRTISLDLPPRAGDSIYGADLTLITDDGRAMGTFPVQFLVRVGA